MLAGLIFHASRCRSTLLARLLATLPGAVVASEPPTVDAVLMDPGWRPAAVRRAIDSLAPEAARLFVKLDAWHALDMAALREVYPTVPFVLLGRDPAAIVASHLREPGRHTVPGLTDARLAIDQALPRVEYIAAVIGALLDAGRRGADERCLVLDGTTLPAGFGVVLDHFGVSEHDRDLAAELVVAGQDAKQPQLPFEPSTSALTAEIRAAAARWAGEPWKLLEAVGPASC